MLTAYVKRNARASSGWMITQTVWSLESELAIVHLEMDAGDAKIREEILISIRTGEVSGRLPSNGVKKFPRTAEFLRKEMHNLVSTLTKLA